MVIRGVVMYSCLGFDCHCGYTMSDILEICVTIWQSLAVMADLGAGVGMATKSGQPWGGCVIITR